MTQFFVDPGIRAGKETVRTLFSKTGSRGHDVTLSRPLSTVSGGKRERERKIESVSMTESVCLYVGEREKDGLRERER